MKLILNVSRRAGIRDYAGMIKNLDSFLGVMKPKEEVKEEVKEEIKEIPPREIEVKPISAKERKIKEKKEKIEEKKEAEKLVAEERAAVMPEMRIRGKEEKTITPPVPKLIKQITKRPSKKKLKAYVKKAGKI